MKRLDKEFKALKKQSEALTAINERKVIANYKKTLDEARVELSKMYEQHASNGIVSWSEANKFSRIEKMDLIMEKKVNALFKSNSKIIKETLSGVAKDTYKNTIAIMEKESGWSLQGIVKKLDVSKTINKDMAGLEWSSRLNNDRNNLIFNINKEVRAGLKAGQTYPEISKNLKRVSEMSVAKSNVIIRTEAHRVHAQARQDSLESISNQGITMMKTWNSSQDERTRDQHFMMDGVEIPFDEDFVLPDGCSGPSPGMIGEAHQDINCRCYISVRMVKDGE